MECAISRGYRDRFLATLRGCWAAAYQDPFPEPRLHEQTYTRESASDTYHAVWPASVTGPILEACPRLSCDRDFGSGPIQLGAWQKDFDTVAARWPKDGSLPSPYTTGGFSTVFAFHPDKDAWTVGVMLAMYLVRLTVPEPPRAVVDVYRSPRVRRRRLNFDTGR